MGRLPHFTRSCCTHGSSVAAILLILALATSWVGAGFAQTPAVQLPRPAKPRIAIVNEKAFHLEVLAGFMHILSEYEDSVTVFMHPLNFDNRALDFGFVEYLHGFKGHLRALPAIGVPQFDMVIFVSPEYRLNYVREFIQRSKPKVVMCMVHNGDAVDVPELLKVHPNVHLMTLSPHVQRFVAARLNTAVDWMLPLKALPVSKPCKHTELPNCLSGFAIQGNMDSRRRNYTEIFRELDKLVNSSATYKQDSRLQINIVGSGRPEKLGVPDWLKTRVIPHTNLRFDDFYELIYHNFALIPALASDSYYDRKFSSTLITSMVTGVPVIVTWRFLQSYSFLNDTHVARQWKGEEPIDVIKRMLKTPAPELAATRVAIGELREQLNARALGMIKKLLKPVEDENLRRATQEAAEALQKLQQKLAAQAEAQRQVELQLQEKEQQLATVAAITAEAQAGAQGLVQQEGDLGRQQQQAGAQAAGHQEQEQGQVGEVQGLLEFGLKATEGTVQGLAQQQQQQQQGALPDQQAVAAEVAHAGLGQDPLA